MDNKKFERFKKFVGMLGSEFDTERALAAKRASEILKEEKLTWSDVIVNNRVIEQPKPKTSSKRYEFDEEKYNGFKNSWDQWSGFRNPKENLYRLNTKTIEKIRYILSNYSKTLTRQEFTFLSEISKTPSTLITELTKAVLDTIIAKYKTKDSVYKVSAKIRMQLSRILDMNQNEMSNAEIEICRKFSIYAYEEPCTEDEKNRITQIIAQYG